jgi:uncharacterized membrane protein
MTEAAETPGAQATQSPQASVAEDASQLPFVAPCRDLAPDAAWRWLRKGWADFRAAPKQSLGYGVVIMLLSWIVTGVAFRYGSYWAALILLSGFVFVAPVLALGLYSISRQLERGRVPVLGRCFIEQHKAFGNAMVFALALLVLFLIWARAGSMVHVFFPAGGSTDIRHLLMFLGIGSVVGSVFALLTFIFSAFSLPMICDREADAVTAIVTSVNAVLRNKRAMMLWAGMIVALTAIGFATAFIGLAVTIPVLGHATWHAYRETIDASAWPANDPVQG